MKEQEEQHLLKGEEETTTSCVQCFKFTSKKIQNFIDWIPLIAFYVLQGSVPFQTCCLIPTMCGLGTILFTFIRSRIDTQVVFPKVMDVSFVIVFLIFTVICSMGGEFLLEIWSNAAMNGSLALIMYISCFLNQPFALPYAIEAGMPKNVATAPIVLYHIRGASMEWAYAIAAMAVVSCVAPLYLCYSSDNGCYSQQDATYSDLNLIFTNAAQYAILVYMLLKFMYFEPKKRQEIENWTFRTSREIQSAYGMPTLYKPSEKGNLKNEVGILSGVDPLNRNLQGAPIGDKFVDEKFQRAIRVIAKSFLHDPMIMKWPEVGAYPIEKRLKACEGIFSKTIRAAAPLNHTAFVDNISYCAAIPCWERGDEHDIFLNPAAMKIMEWDQPLPPVELVLLREKLNSALQGRKHMYISTFATDPVEQGKGYGSLCMRSMLAIADRKKVITSLETMTDKNRKMYEHYGFRVVGSLNVSGCTDPWVAMVRDVPNDDGCEV